MYAGNASVVNVLMRFPVLIPVVVGVGIVAAEKPMNTEPPIQPVAVQATTVPLVQQQEPVIVIPAAPAASEIKSLPVLKKKPRE